MDPKICRSSNICAALGSGLAMRSIVNKGFLVLGDWHLDWPQRLHNSYHSQFLVLLFWEGSWIHFCSSSGTFALSWKSSDLFTLSCLGMIIFICTFPWTLMSLSTSTSCHSGNTLLSKETIQGHSTTSGRILIPHYNSTTLSLRGTLGDKIDNAR